MTRKVFMTVAWGNCETHFDGPYDNRDAALEELQSNYLGEENMDAGIIGPLPFEQVIHWGKHGTGETTELDKSIARQWAVFLTTDKNLQWMTFGDGAEEFDQQRDAGHFEWVGNYEGANPAEVYAQLIGDGHEKPEGKIWTAIPVGVFGPTDWMRAAGDMLTKIQG